MSDVGNISTRLMDEEKKRREEKIARLTKMVNDIEKVLIDNQATWGDWHAVVNTFNDRNDRVMPNLTISFIKERAN